MIAVGMSLKMGYTCCFFRQDILLDFLHEKHCQAGGFMHNFTDKTDRT